MAGEIMNITTVFLLAGGLGLFLYGMKLMSEGLEQVAGSRMRSILEFFTKNRFVGMLVGILFTAVVQSSSATTVMVVSFVNSGLMTLSQATGVILGANIGTTVTGQLIAFNLSDAAPFFVFGVAVTALVSILQVGWKVTAKPLKPKGDKFNPINGFKRIFSKDSLFELLKSILKIGLIIYVAYTSIKGEANDIFILYDIPLNQAVVLCGNVIINAGFKISLVYLVVGIADFVYQKHRFNEDMKMTKQELKDEYKNTEGNPEIKGRQRQRMREAS